MIRYTIAPEAEIYAALDIVGANWLVRRNEQLAGWFVITVDGELPL